MDYSIFTDDELMDLLKILVKKQNETDEENSKYGSIRSELLGLALYMNNERGFVIKVYWDRVIL